MPHHERPRRWQEWFRLRRRRLVPVMLPHTVHDCGAACLAMVLGYHGRRVRIDDIRHVTGTGRHGSTAAALVETGQQCGLVGRGVRLEIEDLAALPPATILHWNFNHFVVFERMRRGGVQLVDPASGRCIIPLSKVRTSFTGIAVLFEPGESFNKAPARRSGVRAFLRLCFDDPREWIRVAVLSVALQIGGLGLPMVTSRVVDRVVPSADWDLLGILAAGIAALVAFHLVCALLRSHLLVYLRARVDARLTLGLLRHMIDLPYSFFQSRSAGDLMARLNNNAAIRDIITSSALSALIDGSLVCTYLLILAVLSPSMAGLVALLGALQISLYAATRARQRDLAAQALHVQAASHGYQIEMLNGMETLKAMGCEQRAVDHWTRIFMRSLDVARLRARLGALVDSSIGALRLASPLAVLLFGTVQVLHGTISLGAMLGLAAVASGVLGPLSNVISATGQLQLLRGYLERMEDTLAAEPEQPDPREPPPRLLGRISLDRVSFRYSARAPLVVRDVSVEIAPGQLVAIVGPSGCGKSTLASLLVGLQAPTSGRVSYDGLDLAQLDLRQVRRQLGVVMQRPALFAGSIRGNIALTNPELALDAVAEAARIACIHDEILGMRLGYETILHDGGASLSGGQRQRLTLARALASRPAILLLDEATNALDAVTERRVHAALARLECTRILVAHRLSTVIDADLILVMQDGAIVQRGTHAQLLADPDGIYVRLFAAQLHQVPHTGAARGTATENAT